MGLLVLAILVLVTGSVAVLGQAMVHEAKRTERAAAVAQARLLALAAAREGGEVALPDREGVGGVIDGEAVGRVGAVRRAVPLRRDD